jgi:hypothetical protein
MSVRVTRLCGLISIVQPHTLKRKISRKGEGKGEGEGEGEGENFVRNQELAIITHSVCVNSKK